MTANNRNDRVLADPPAADSDRAGLPQAEELNRRIAESIVDCVKILDLDGRFLYLNSAGQRTLAVIFAVLIVVNQVLMLIWKQ